jgi:hypothetical protein
MEIIYFQNPTLQILALGLADGHSPADCIRLYLRLKDDIFGATGRPYPAVFF